MITTLAAILGLCALAVFAALTVALNEAERPYRPHRASRARDPLLDDLELMADALATPSLRSTDPMPDLTTSLRAEGRTHMSRVTSSREPLGPQRIVFELDDNLLISGPQVEAGFAYLRAACEAFEFAEAARTLRNMAPGTAPPIMDAVPVGAMVSPLSEEQAP